MGFFDVVLYKFRKFKLVALLSKVFESLLRTYRLASTVEVYVNLFKTLMELISGFNISLRSSLFFLIRALINNIIKKVIKYVFLSRPFVLVFMWLFRPHVLTEATFLLLVYKKKTQEIEVGCVACRRHCVFPRHPFRSRMGKLQA